MRGNRFCTACGLCALHHDGPLCRSDEDYECAWDPVGFDLRRVIMSAGAGHIPRHANWNGCPYCRYDRGMIINMTKPPMSFTDGMWERARSSTLP